jgi:tetratricopeptide (TPR) repeat protein
VAAAQRALELDPSLAAGHEALGTIAFFLEWDWQRAEVAYRRSIELDPGFVLGRASYSIALAHQGRIDEALAQVRKVIEIDPLAVSPGNVDLGLLLVWKGDRKAAVEAWHDALELSPSHYTSLLNLGGYYCKSGRTDEGFELLRRARARYPQTPQVLAEIGACHAVAGDPDAAREVLDELEAWTLREYVDPVNLAVVHLALGEDDQVFAWLERGYERRAFLMTQIGSDPRYERLYGDPRFRDLTERIGLREPTPRD